MVLRRALAIWVVLMAAEFVHGALRTIAVAPYAGDFQARQISVFTGSLIILSLAYLSVRWMGARSTRALAGVGLMWLMLTLAFEVGLGRFAFGLSWERIASDYDLRRGGLLPIGLVLLALAPLIAARVRARRGR